METVEELEVFLAKRTANYRTLQVMKRRQAWMGFTTRLELQWYTSWAIWLSTGAGELDYTKNRKPPWT